MFIYFKWEMLYVFVILSNRRLQAENFEQFCIMQHITWQSYVFFYWPFNLSIYKVLEEMEIYWNYF